MKKNGFFQIIQKVFIRKENLFLVLRDNKSKVGDLPGGRINEDEFFSDWLVSIRRELFEELGKNFVASIYPEPFLVQKHRVEEGQHPCVIIGYNANYISGEIETSEEHDYFEWVDISTYQPEVLFKGYMLQAVKKYLNICRNNDQINLIM